MLIPNRRSRRRGAVAMAIGAMTVMGLLSAHGLSSLLPSAHGSSTEGRGAPPSAVARVAMRLADSPGDTAVPPDALVGSPEARLIAIYRLIADNRLDTALRAAQALTQTEPNFKLAQLVNADLMSARFGELTSFGTAERRLTGVAATELGELKSEARLRLQALQERPPQAEVPDEFVTLPPSTPYAIAVDTSRARLYLFRNGPQGLHLIDDFYVSVGKQGVDKLVEGDQRTPLGVYFVTTHLDPHALQRRFGAGALPLNYPNAYDKFKGRTGSGILLHGVPADTYARPPLDSDGCVAMANDDLRKLAAELPLRGTPVVITRKINWVPQQQRPSMPGLASFDDALAKWQQARMHADRSTLEAFYADDHSGAGTAEQRQLRERLATPPVKLDEVSLVTWHDDQGKMVVTFREVASSPRHDHVMRQYWDRQGSQWRIVAEGQVL